MRCDATVKRVFAAAAVVATCGVGQAAASTPGVARSAVQSDAGTPSVVIRSAASAPVTSGLARATASCNPGEVAVGGGGSPTSGSWSTVISQPENASGGTSGTPTQWAVVFGNYMNGGGAGAVPNAYVVCVRATAFTPVIRTAVGTTMASGVTSETVSCNPGEVAVGGGGSPAYGNWRTVLSQPENASGATNGTPTQWVVDFAQYTSGLGAVPNAFVVCVSATALTPVIRSAVGTTVTTGLATETVSCNPGEVAVGGGGSPTWNDWTTVTSQPQNASGATSGTPTEWAVEFGQYTAGQAAVPNAFVVCVDAAALAPASPPTGTGSPGGGGHAATLSIGRVAVSGTAARVPLRCQGSGTCKVKLVLSVTEKIKGGKVIALAARGKRVKTKKKVVVVGSVTRTLSGGQSVIVTVGLNGKGKSLLSKHHTLKVKLVASSGTTTLATKTLTFVKHKKTKKRKH